MYARRMSFRSELVTGCGAIDYTEDTETVNEAQPVSLDSAGSLMCATASGDKDDLASGAGLQDFFVCASRLHERQALGNDRAECAILQPCEKRGVDFRNFRRLRCP